MPGIQIVGEFAHFPDYESLDPRGGLMLPTKFPVSDWAFRLATGFLISTLIVHIIAFFIFSARVYTRAFPVFRFTLDDYIICFAFALMNICFGLWYKTVFWAWGGNHPAFRSIDEVTYTSKLGSIALPFWAWSTGLVKISIGVMLLRFQQGSRWRWVIYVMIALNVMLILLTGVVNLFQCVPYKAFWDFKGEIKNKKCWDGTTARAMLYSSSVCNVFTDFVFSLMPLTFLGKIRRPLREKVVVGGLMALGLVASAFSLTKAVINGRIPTMKDPAAAVILLGILSCLEVQTSLIAACIPTLRSSSRRFLQRIGLAHSTRASGDARYAAGSSSVRSPASKRNRRGQLELDEIISAGTGTETTASKRASDGIEVRELDEVQYQMDPSTGRIVCVTELKVHTSNSHLNDEWKRHPGTVMEEEWQAQRDTGSTTLGITR